VSSGEDFDSQKMGATRSYQPPSRPFAVWVTGFADHENRDSNLGFLDGRTSNTGGAIGGVDYTSNRVFSAQDAFVFGVLSGFTDARIKSADGLAKTDVSGPSVGVYGVYVSGGFSVDFNAKADFLDVDQTSILPTFSAGLTNYVTAANLNYKWYAPPSVGGWVEPTVGVVYTVSRWGDGQDALDGHTIRVQGGLRVGQSFNWGGVTIEPSLTGLLYSDVVIDGGTVAIVGLPVAPNDEGKLFEQAILKFNFDLGKGLSSYVEGDVRHGSLGSGREVVGAGGRVGVRYQW